MNLSNPRPVTDLQREILTILAQHAIQRRREQIESRPTVPTTSGSAASVGERTGRFQPFEEAE